MKGTKQGYLYGPKASHKECVSLIAKIDQDPQKRVTKQLQATHKARSIKAL